MHGVHCRYQGCDVAVLPLAAFVDGVQPFAGNCKHTVVPIVVTILTLPSSVAWSRGALHTCAIVPGAKKGGHSTSEKHMLQLFVDELKFLATAGVEVRTLTAHDYKKHGML